MAEHSDLPDFFTSKEYAVENLEMLRKAILSCLNAGLTGPEDSFYNQCLSLMDDARIVENWDEMEDLVTRAKLLESDISTWLAIYGQTTISLVWPQKS